MKRKYQLMGIFLNLNNCNMYLEFDNINQSLIGLSKFLIENNVKRKTRGFDCYELKEPLLFKINNPSDRYITVPERKFNKVLPFVEVLWIMGGINDLELPGSYVKNLYTYSDDGQFMRGGYGPRIRAFTGNNSDYKISNQKHRNVFSGSISVVDQLKYVIEDFGRDFNSRRLIIEIGDPNKDDFNELGDLKNTLDTPCTRLLNFQVRNGKLDLTVYMRSNDHIFGAHGVNITNFTFIQEIVSNILGIESGDYYHFSNNYHYYENFQEKIEELASVDARLYITEEKWHYKDKLDSLKNFDRLIDELYLYEQELRIDKNFYDKDFGNDMFNDWGKVFLYHHAKRVVKFDNPYLIKLFGFKN